MPDNSLPQIVILDACPTDAGDVDWSPLREMGELTIYENTLPADVEQRVANANIILTNKVKMGTAAFEAAPHLKMLSVLATGYDIIDLNAARAHGVTICNVPAYSTASTAQATVALILELAYRIGAHDASVKQGDWTRSPLYSYWNYPLVELEGKTLVLVGTGSIGTRVGTICQAMGMKVISAQLPGRSASHNSPFERLPLDEALPLADVVSLGCPATAETRKLANADFVGRLKTSAFLVNTARGVLVDDEAVAAALQEGRLAGFAGDVLSVEPPPADNPLLTAPNCILTPHIAWASVESRRRLVAASVVNVREFLSGKAQNVVS